MSSELYLRYQDLEVYVGWTEEDAARIRQNAEFVRQQMHVLVEDFYSEIAKHPEAAKVITGGAEQVVQLKQSLWAWLSESLDGRRGEDYVIRRWNIGLRHAELGLNPAYTSAAMSRLRNGLFEILASAEHLTPESFRQLIQSFNKLFDLDLSIIQDAYQAEYLKQEKLAEHERSEVKFRGLVEAAACMVVILRADDTIAYFSPYSEEVTGYTADEVMGRSFQHVFLPDTARTEMSKARDATLAGRRTKAYETPILRRDGTRRWLVWNARRLNEFEGAPAVLAVGQDFTERREAQERLFRTERLAGIGQMVTGIAHESRNALQRIQSCSEMLELEIEGSDEAIRLVRRIQEAQDNLLRLFDEVRGFAAPIQLDCTSCRIQSLWEEAWRQLEMARRGRNARLVENADIANPNLIADRFRMVQVFRNLLENSLSACDDPAIIEIHCYEATLRGRPAIAVRVRDNGPGLTAEARLNAFEPFFTTKTKGTGLGMAIARRIVEAHGGDIDFGVTLSQGAEFVITLPRIVP